MGTRFGVLVCAAALVAAAVAGGARADQYDPPPAYYSTTAGLTGAALQQRVHEIISAGHMVRSYADATTALPILDRDPSNPTRVILVYNGQSVPSTWDSGGTWNREHTWPDSRGLGGSGRDYTDLHQLRPCNPSINGSRSNKPFGWETVTSYWDPGRYGQRYRGEMARAMMYMDVRYDGQDSGTVDLDLVNGFPAGSQMGDLAAMLEWHYLEPPDERERRRNHFAYSSADNPQYFQGNRNPFVDHPEFVWALWGPTPNDSTIYLGMDPMADGSSSVAIDLGDVIAGGAGYMMTLPVFKIGANPTTYEIVASGDASLDFDGRRQAFASGMQMRDVDVVVEAAAPGDHSGAVTINNTDLTSAGAGAGEQDGDDVAMITWRGLAGANPSFEAEADIDEVMIDFGVVPAGEGRSTFVEIHNFGPDAPFAAGLDLDSVNASGHTGQFTLDVALFDNLPPGGDAAAEVILAPAGAPGLYEATFTLAFSDANLPGASARGPLTLTLFALVTSCIGDLDGDGQVGAADLSIILGAWGTASAAADLSGDGTVGPADLAILLGAWGVCE